MRPLVLALAIIAAGFGRANAQEPPEKTVDAAIKAFLKATEGKRPDPAKLTKFGELKKRILLLDPDSLASMTLKDLQAAIDSIINGGTDEKTRAAAEELRKKLLASKAIADAKAEPGPKEKFVKLANEIVALAAANKDKIAADPFAPQAHDDAARAAVLALASLLDAWALSDYVKAPQYVQERLAGLATLLKRDIEERSRLRVNAIREAALVPNSSLAGKFNEFETAAVDAFATKAYVYVVRAWAGDLASHWRDGYQCDATRTVRKICDAAQADPGKAGKCTPALTTAEAGKVRHVDVGEMCGYDPYPAPYDRNRGLVVEYFCFPDTIAYRRAAERVAAIEMRIGKPHSATLRRTDAEIYCPKPDAEFLPVDSVR